MKKFNILLGHHRVAFYSVFSVCALMFILAFFLPPMAIVDASILKGISLLGLFYPMFLAGEAIERGADAKISLKDKSISIDMPNEKEKE